MKLLKDENRDYRRFNHSPQEKFTLAKNGFQAVQSSNVSAVGVEGQDLLIRFHNGSVYRYFFMGEQFLAIMGSNSKGKWVWRNLRRAGVPYEKSGGLPLPDDVNMTDEELFDLTDNRYFEDMVKFIDGEVVRRIVETEFGKMEYMNVNGREIFKLL